MVEREGALVVHEAVIAEEAAGGVADDDVAAGAGLVEQGVAEVFVGPDHCAAGAGDGEGALGDQLAGAVVELEGGGGAGVPGGGGRVDEAGEGAAAAHAELEEEAGGEAGGRAGVALRLVAVGHGGVVDMGAEAAFGGVGGVAVLVADEAVEPAIGVAAVAEVVDEFGVAFVGAELGEVEGEGVVAGEVAEEAFGDQAALGVEGFDADGEGGLALGHGGGEDDAAELGGGEDGEGEEVAAAEEVGEGLDAGVGLEVGAFDVEVGDAGAAGCGDFVAGADDVAAGAEFELGGPVDAREEAGDIERDRGVGGDVFVEGDRVAGAHAVERDGAGGDGGGVAVLEPEHDGFGGFGGGQAGVMVAGPGVGVVGAGEGAFGAGAVGVEGVFDDVVPGGADRVDEELAFEGGEGEAGADLGAVEREAGGAGGDGLFPFGEDVAVGGEEAEPEADGAGAVVGPVIGGDEAGVEAGTVVQGRAAGAGVAEEGVVGGEVETVEVAGRVGEEGGGEAGFVEGENGGAGGDLGGDAGGDAGGVEGGDQEGGAGGAGQVDKGGGGDAGAVVADLGDVVDVAFGGWGHGGVEGPEGIGDAVGVVDGEGAGGAEAGGEGSDAFGGEGVGEGFVEHVAAGPGVEGLDVEHGVGV